MIIVGKNDDGYKSIKIKDNEIIIDNDTNMIKNIKDESSYEIIIKTVETFLWNNTINYLSNNEVKSVDGKRLIFNTSFDNVIRMKVLDKYLIDRTYHLCHSDSVAYEVKASNKFSCYKDNSYTIKLRNGEFTYEELVFLTKLLNNTFDNEHVGLRFVDNKPFISNVNYDGKYVVFKNIKENNMTSSICELVSYHNKNVYDRRNNKKLIKEMK